MIFNRTLQDVNSAREIRLKVKKFEDLTSTETATIEKGSLTHNTLNRIENKQKSLKSLINGIGYYNINIQNKTWKLGDKFYDTDIQRIVNNENNLRQAFITYASTPNTPISFLYFEDTNAIEKILNDLDIMINDIKSNYRECGAFECGGD